MHGYMLKNPHSCKDTKMATPLEVCRGMSRPVNCTVTKTWRIFEHVSRPCERVFAADLWSFFMCVRKATIGFTLYDVI